MTTDIAQPASTIASLPFKKKSLKCSSNNNAHKNICLKGLLGNTIAHSVGLCLLIKIVFCLGSAGCHTTVSFFFFFGMLISDSLRIF